MEQTHSLRKEDGKIGVWLFLCTEMILFIGLFLLYSMYRMENSADFSLASHEQSLIMGTTNTIVLITSSFIVALAIHFYKERKKKLAGILLLGTVFLGFVFLTVKGFEWGEKITSGIYPDSVRLESMPKGEILYQGLYYLMTGLHALHVIVGISILIYVYIRINSEKTTGEYSGFFENTGLYWHLVDIIWIFLFPLFYLIS